MNLQRIKVFLYAIDTGSFSKAAAAFNYTPSGISHMMTALEEEVGFPLMIRTKTGITPTENAQKLIPIMRAQCKWDEQFSQTTSEIQGLVSGNLTIAAYSSIASQWLPQIIKEFHRDYPYIKIKILDGVWQEVENNLLERKADLGFYSYQPTIRHQWIPLREDPMVVALPPDHPLAQKQTVSLSEIKEESIIMPAFGNDIDVTNILKEENIQIDFQFSTLQNYSALGMVEQGLGLLIMNRLITQGRTNSLKLLPLDPPRSVFLGIAVPFENRRTPAVAKFIDYAQQVIQS